eukprot:CAMPEP_0113686898 /NCGR_PEP_ID=MMETSP0038_2-20120614/15576_1 /TAXON_ID=2898 /ORGANISM="Cryptomonas paramecium" /LENGTH=68 /DNA_ID=CAMNT_0000607333 /DNA_START=89 /DNA_END=292 /DNA_ORIENTATION=- /assembly_acc=CAM_ASM_000170
MRNVAREDLGRTVSTEVVKGRGVDPSGFNGRSGVVISGTEIDAAVAAGAAALVEHRVHLANLGEHFLN